MESRLDHESAGLGWNPQAGHSTSLDFCFFLQVAKVLAASSTVWKVVRITKPLGSHGTLFSLPRGTLDHLPFLRASCPGICHFHEVRRLFRKGTTSESQKIKQRRLSPPLVGKHEQTNFRFSSHILFLNLRCLVEGSI